jgi:hypothetical protein
MQLLSLSTRLFHCRPRLLHRSSGRSGVASLPRVTRRLPVRAHSRMQLLHLRLISLVDRADLRALRLRKAELLI